MRRLILGRQCLSGIAVMVIAVLLLTFGAFSELAGEKNADSNAAPARTWVDHASESAWKRVQELLAHPGSAWPDTASTAAGEQVLSQPGTVSVARALSRSADARQRQRAVELWSVSPSRESTAGLLVALEDPDEGVRLATARVLSALDSLEIMNRVLEVLAVPASAEAAAIFGMLPELRPQLEAPMMNLLGREDAPHEHRWAAAYCLGRMGCTNAAPLLMRLTQSSEDAVLARTAAAALAGLRSPESSRDWLELSRHADPEVRRMAIEAIAVTGGRESIEFLRATAYGIEEQDLYLQSVAVQQIATLPHATAVPLLIDIMKNRLPMRSEATYWLRNITGMDIPENPIEWEQWYKIATGQMRPPLVAADEEEPPPPPLEEDKAFPKVPPEWGGQTSPIEVGQWEQSR